MASHRYSLPAVHGLVRFGRGKHDYKKAAMVDTLADRRGEGTRKTLAKLSPAKLEKEMQMEFFGAGWISRCAPPPSLPPRVTVLSRTFMPACYFHRYAPKLMSRERQDEAVRQAKLHCTPESGDWAHEEVA